MSHRQRSIDLSHRQRSIDLCGVLCPSLDITLHNVTDKADNVRFWGGTLRLTVEKILDLNTLPMYLDRLYIWAISYFFIVRFAAVDRFE